MSTVFRVWVQRSDVYIAARSIAGTMKVSLHESGVWRMAFTTQHVEQGSTFVAPTADRLMERWQRPPEYEPGWTAAFEIIVPHSELGPAPQPARPEPRVFWHPDPGAGLETRYWILIAGAGVEEPVPLPRGAVRQTVIGRLGLVNGETVYVGCLDVRPPPEWVDHLADLKARLGTPRAEAISGAIPPGDALRGYFFGDYPNGARVWIDLDYSTVTRSLRTEVNNV
jgi:hypothetical protein